MPSVLQPWVESLPLRAQGTLLTGVRGCDFAPKNPCTIDERYGCSTGEDTPERKLTAFLRYCTLVPADPAEIDIPGAWFQSKPPAVWKPSQLTHYPLHWYAHLMHCFEVVGYLRPTTQSTLGSTSGAECTFEALRIYNRMATALHLNIETAEQLLERLTENRILAGTVVS